MEEKKECQCKDCYSYDWHENTQGEGFCWHWYEFVKPEGSCKDFS